MILGGSNEENISFNDDADISLWAKKNVLTAASN